jgi:hypothetical protein
VSAPESSLRFSRSPQCGADVGKTSPTGREEGELGLLLSDGVSGKSAEGEGGERGQLMSEQDEEGSLVICRVCIFGLGGAPGKPRVCARGLVGPYSRILPLPCFCERFSPSRNCLGSSTLHQIPYIMFSSIYR